MVRRQRFLYFDWYTNTSYIPRQAHINSHPAAFMSLIDVDSLLVLYKGSTSQRTVTQAQMKKATRVRRFYGHQRQGRDLQRVP